MKYLFVILLVFSSMSYVLRSSGNEKVKNVESPSVIGWNENHIWDINKRMSKINWIGYGSENVSSGTINICEGNLKIQGSLIIGGDFTIDMNSMAFNEKNNNPAVDQLKNSGLFDSEHNPEGRFVITDVGQKKGNKQEMTAEITFNDVTQSIRFTTEIITSDGRYHIFIPDFKVDRSLWNSNYQKENSGNQQRQFIYDDIKLNIRLVTM